MLKTVHCSIVGLTHNFQKKVDRGKYVSPSFGETIVNTDPGCFPSLTFLLLQI